jgi:hypothetical protein
MTSLMDIISDPNQISPDTRTYDAEKLYGMADVQNVLTDVRFRGNSVYGPASALLIQ